METLYRTIGPGGVFIVYAYTAVVALLWVIFPLYVYSINRKLREIQDQNDEVLEELKTQNKLSRQLIRSYNIEPEA